MSLHIGILLPDNKVVQNYVAEHEENKEAEMRDLCSKFSKATGLRVIMRCGSNVEVFRNGVTEPAIFKTPSP